MLFFDKAFYFRKYDLEIFIPKTIELVETENKLRFRGTKEDISELVKQLFKLKSIKEGGLCKLGKYTLKVSDYISEDRIKENWIELPGHAWGIMGSKFIEVPFGIENNPFDFNDCEYTEHLDFDFGVEVIDMPIRYLEFKDDGTYHTKTIAR